MKMQWLWAIVLMLGGLTAARADSPLTSVRFAEAYRDLSIVTAADSYGVLDPKMAGFLSDQRMPIDAKAALCNALGWDIAGKHNAVLFRCWLALKYGVVPEQLTTADMSADEVFALGYLTALDDYFLPAPALELLAEARRRNPQSQTVALVASLAEAQLDLNENRWGRIWPRADRILHDVTLRQDMRPDAVANFVDYLLLYRVDAETGGSAPAGK